MFAFVIILNSVVLYQDDEKPVAAKKLRRSSQSKFSGEVFRLRGDLSTKDALQVGLTLVAFCSC